MSGQIETKVEKKLNQISMGENIHGTGIVKCVRQYLVEVSGLSDAGFYEKVYIGNKAEGYVESIDRTQVVISIMKMGEPIVVGDEVYATGETYCSYFSEDFQGNIINLFGEDILNGRIYDNLEEIPMETPAIPILERTTVCVPLETGIIGIDLMYPIGRGQRQLIIGDKKTGKTQIILDTMVNQAGKDMICIYVAIGKTKKEVKEVYTQLLRNQAMNHAIIMAAFHDDCAPVIRNTPYVAMSIAEKFMKQGRNVLVAIDDLSKHADVCREMALLAGKVPGRDAYPPDIFYSHARLLEKGCQYQNGGSITILPVVETKGGDITDYISTNIISITDGQLVLSSNSFQKGEKPAIHYGLSVSRLGGAVQTPQMKKLGTKLKRLLLTYLENKEVFELANADEMGDELKHRMKQGASIQERLKQYKFSPLSEEQIQKLFFDIAD